MYNYPMKRPDPQKLPDERLNDILRRILSVSQPEKIVLYGSRARRDNGKLSDFDIALFGDVNLGKVLDVLDEANTLLKIDVVAFDGIRDTGFRQRIMDEGLVIYERKI